MPTEVRVPTLGESVVDAVVGTWLKKEGDQVASGETLVELETDKVNVEVIAQEAGLLEKIMKQEGETVNVGEVIAAIDESAAAPAETAEQSSAQAAPAAAAAAPAPPAQTPARAPEAEPAEVAGGVRATPGVRRLAAEYDLDLSKVPASGESGRVTREDVLRYALNRPSAEPAPAAAPTNGATQATIPPAAPTAPVAAPQAAPTSLDEALGRREERVRMTRRRQTIAQRLVEAQHTAAMLTTFNEVDMSAVMDLRKRRRDAFKEQHGVGLGFMSFFTKAVVGALKTFPRVNSELQGAELVLKKYYDIGIAVGAEEGLVVPVVRDADRLSFAAIEQEIVDLATKARDNKLSLDELLGGTFTITNGGIYGSLLSTPILNPPQVGILGMHKIEQRPVVVDGEVVVRPMMYLALSYDHRVVDGQEAVQFLVRVKQLLEDPETLLLEG
jgi:2-oxoglutarate dehydrogenase E2 component (dihydrolipoamide succinyltransferase)